MPYGNKISGDKIVKKLACLGGLQYVLKSNFSLSICTEPAQRILNKVPFKIFISFYIRSCAYSNNADGMNETNERKIKVLYFTWV